MNVSDDHLNKDALQSSNQTKSRHKDSTKMKGTKKKGAQKSRAQGQFGGQSMQDQLRAAGLVTDKQVRKAQKGMHRQEMRVKQGIEAAEDKFAAEQALAAKQSRDREQNEKLNQAAEAKALLAQVKQLIDLNSQRQEGDVKYEFSEQNKVKSIYVSPFNKTQLNKGFLAIVRAEDRYDLVPEKVARRISDRLSDSMDDVVLYLYDRAKDEVDEDDPYKDFQIPDDLEW